MEKYYIKNDNNRVENPFLTQGEGKKRVRRGREEGKRWIGWRMLRVAAVLGVMMGWMMPAMAQQMTEFEGVWYIASNGSAYQAGTTTNLPYTYNPDTPSTNFYLRPADDPQIPDQTDAYFDGSGQTKPFLTSNKTGHTDIALWALEKTDISYTTSSGTEYYYTIQHVETGKYVVCDPFFSGTLGEKNDSRRKTMHLETKEWTTTIPEKALFKIRYTADESTGSGDVFDSYCFIPKRVENKPYKYLNLADRNQPVNYGTKANQYYGGLAGLYTFGTTPANVVDINSRFKFEQYVVAQPTITFNNATNEVTITSSVAGAKIFYTTNGDTPTSDLTPHTSPVTFTQATPCIIRAIAVKSWISSGVEVSSIEATPYDLQKVATPTFSLNTGNNVLTITSTTGASIYYSIGAGNTPSIGVNPYAAPFEVPYAQSNQLFRAIAVKEGWITSDTGEGTIKLSCYKPVISFNSNTQQVTITCADVEATIYYTTNGDPPTTSSTPYNGTGGTGAFNISSACTVSAIAVHTPNYNDSDPSELPITQVATPTIQNNGSNAISITCATEGATIFYTTDENSTPNIEYTAPLTEGFSGVTIYAIAVKENMINSEVGDGTVMLRCATPVITRVDMTFTLSCSMPTDASLYYRLGSGEETEYIEAVSFTPEQLPTTVTAVARHSNYTDSETATLELTSGTGSPTDPYLIYSVNDFSEFVANVNNGTTASACYKLMVDLSVSGTSAITTAFTGTFDGNFHTLTNLGHPIFNTINGGTVKNVMLSGVAISSDVDTVGAITNIAKGYSRIYNCGILPNDNTFPKGTHPTVTTTGKCAGGLVGSLRNDSRVVNCFSYADVSSTGYAAGIVGNNTFASNTAVTDGKYANLRTMVVNCMFYGDITAGSTVWPVYGGTKITNAGATAINNYNFYSDSCHFSAPLETSHNYYCSWPAKYDYLTRYEFHRYLLNSNRELCGWWVGAPEAPSTMTTANVQAVPKDATLMAKWVLDRNVAPFPILKPFDTYSSPINIDADASWRTSANKWEGKKLGTLRVTINPGGHAASGITSTTKNIVITDMDTIHGDYCYRKIQLPYYNEIFGAPNGTTWTEKYGGNYTDFVATGWEITSTNGAEGTFTANWQDGYNFADRYCSKKDIYNASTNPRIFAQGGYYYVPYDVTEITITAHWGKAVYLGNGDNNYDRVDFNHLLDNEANSNRPGTAFEPAGTRPATLGNGQTILTGKIATVADSLPNSGTVFDNALVLVGNHQYCTGGEDVAPSRSFTIMSADFDLDNEPDYCLEWQLGVGTTRQSICPIRFDFLPVIEIGLGLKKDGSTQYYSLGCYRPLGHYEVTETALIRFGQFEFSNKNRTVYAPLILNGGIYEQYVKGTNGNAFSSADDKIDYIIIGGNVYMPNFSPGAHVNSNASFPTRHCAVNAIGGKFDNLFLTGNFNDAVTPNADNPHCYIDGGWFGQVAAAGKEGINGNVFFELNHAVVHEFYGGGTIADKRVTGNIEVTVDSSRVYKYCGGPKFGDMYEDKTVTTHATGTTFGVFYGGGNGGTSYVQFDRTDGEQSVTYTFNLNVDSGGHHYYYPGEYRDLETGYQANYDMTITNVSTGTNPNKAIYRSYFFAAQFSATNTGDISNTLTGCKVLKNYYGGGNLGGVDGNVTSILDNTEVQGSAFGAGFSASIPTVTIYNKDKTPPSIDVYTGNITPQSGGTSTTYTWTNETSLGGTSLSTSSPAVLNPNGDEINYFFTEKPLQNLGTVSGRVSLTITGNSVIGTSGVSTTGNVYGGGDQSAVTGNTTVHLQGNARVLGNVYGGGNEGPVGGNSEVIIQDP